MARDDKKNKQSLELVSFVLLLLIVMIVSACTSAIVTRDMVIRYRVLSASKEQPQYFAEPSAYDTKINLNTATAEELESLHGIGEVLANRIIANRPYDNKWEVATVQGIGDNTIKQIIDFVEV